MLRARRLACLKASRIRAAPALGNSDQSRAIAPVTKGAAALVPQNVFDCPSVPRLAMFCPGAASPLLPMEPPRFDSIKGAPRWSTAMTRITEGWPVRVELPTVPWLPAAATVMAPRSWAKSSACSYALLPRS